MAEYTWDDIIINPASERIKEAVGRECYFDNNPGNVLGRANYGDTVNILPLKEIEPNSAYPFIFDGVKGPVAFSCIIVKKEEPKPKYVPFVSKEEFIEAFHYHDTSKYSETDNILLIYGIWLKSKYNEAYKMVSEIWDDGVVIGDRKMRSDFANQSSLVFNDITTWEELIEEYEFLDHSPCGKLMEE